MNIQDQQRIQELEKKLEEKQKELEKLYGVVDSLNSCIGGIIKETESGIRAATSLYRKLASKKLPKVKGFTFASKYSISKDDLNGYFDIFETPQHEGAGVIMCDARGYGTSAVVMSFASSLVDSKTTENCMSFFHSLNQELDNCSSIKDTGKDMASLIKMNYLLIDKSSLEMELCSAGMPELLIARGDDIISTNNSDQSSLIAPQRTSMRLLPGDRLVMVNNGFIDSEDENGVKFGIERLKKCLRNAQHLPISDIISNIAFELNTFTDDKRNRLKGDISILGIEVERKMFYVV